MTKVPGSPEWDVPDDHFRRLFGIPAEHELRRVSYQVVNIDTQEWEHEELKAGVLVARYTSNYWISDGGGAGAGFSKYAPDGTHLANETCPELYDLVNKLAASRLRR